MGDVCRKSESVLIWLGHKDEYERTKTGIKGMETLQRVLRDRVEEWISMKKNSYVDIRKHEQAVEEIMKHFNLPGPDSAKFSELRKLFERRPWFGRAWIY
jgi:hypothetical protein